MKWRLYIIVFIVIDSLLLLAILFGQSSLEKTHVKIEFINQFYRSAEQTERRILVLGDSTIAFGVKPKALGSSAISLAVPGSTMLTVKFELNRYLAAFPKPKCVLLSTASIEQYYDQYFWSVYLASELFTRDEASKMYTESVEKNVFPAKKYSRSYYDLKSFFFTHLYVSSLQQRRFRESIGLDSPAQKFFVTESKKISEQNGFIGFVAEDSAKFDKRRNEYLLSAFTPSDSDDTYLRDIAALTSQQGIKLVFAEMPIILKWDPRVAAFNEAHLQNVSSILKDQRGTKVIRWTGELSEGDFKDISHLNEVGAEKFSAVLSKSLAGECD